MYIQKKAKGGIDSVGEANVTEGTESPQRNLKKGRSPRQTREDVVPKKTPRRAYTKQGEVSSLRGSRDGASPRHTEPLLPLTGQGNQDYDPASQTAIQILLRENGMEPLDTSEMIAEGSRPIKVLPNKDFQRTGDSLDSLNRIADAFKDV